MLKRDGGFLMLRRDGGFGMHGRALRLGTLLATVLACSSDPGGSGGIGPLPVDSTVPGDSLNFLRAALTAPPLAERNLSFWAVRGQTREIRLMYRPMAGQSDSVEFARFRVEAQSLINDSAGKPIAAGDSILITLGVQDTLHLVTEFHPSGLHFNPAKPARLWLKFGEADPDLNGDGIVNAADTTLLMSLTIWKQEQPGDPWILVPSSVNLASQEVEADILGFTRFAVAY
jgi:hypothetical protein